MTTTTAEIFEHSDNYPGVILKEARENKGYSREHVAGRLHLRVRIIELLECNGYENLPEPVFIKGYLRAYSKLLDIDPEPLVEQFNAMHIPEKGQERTIWQSQREVNRGVQMVRWLSLMSFLVVLFAVGIWWHNSKDSLTLSKAGTSIEEKQSNKITLTDLNKMQTKVELPKRG